jgi:hypothetical protein
MRYMIEVETGNWTTGHDLAAHQENIRIALHDAVRDVADNVFPEYVFGDVVAEA